MGLSPGTRLGPYQIVSPIGLSQFVVLLNALQAIRPEPSPVR